MFLGDRAVSPIYHQAYRFYAANERDNERSVFVKTDHDIVYIQERRFAEFLRFRVEHPRYVIVTANVVDYGVCTLFQQRNGSIPPDLPGFKRPPGKILRTCARICIISNSARETTRRSSAGCSP